MSRSRVCRGLLAGLLGIALIAPATAAPLNKLERRGKALLTTLCSECHAVGTSGRSPRLRAPPLRTIAARYDIANLVEQLREGFTAPHPDMPTFTFSRSDAEAVQAYLNLIQK